MVKINVMKYDQSFKHQKKNKNEMTKDPNWDPREEFSRNQFSKANTTAIRR